MRLFQIDAFTDAAFKGNPAALCLLDGRSVDDAWMQNVAAEMRRAWSAEHQQNYQETIIADPSQVLPRRLLRTEKIDFEKSPRRQPSTGERT